MIIFYFVVIVIYVLTMVCEMQNRSKVYLNISVTVCLALIYMYNLLQLFKYMNTDKNPALKPEYYKMVWQAIIIMFGLFIIFTFNISILLSYPSKTGDVIFTYSIVTFCTDFPSLGYVMICHNRSFKRVLFVY